MFAAYPEAARSCTLLEARRTVLEGVEITLRAKDATQLNTRIHIETATRVLNAHAQRGTQFSNLCVFECLSNAQGDSCLSGNAVRSTSELS